jgi:hypothetical protein
VRSGRKRYGLGRSGRFAYLGVSLAGYVRTRDMYMI